MKEQVIESEDGKEYKVLWTRQPPGKQEPVLVEILPKP
jgi:hypothetical protein